MQYLERPYAFRHLAKKENVVSTHKLDQMVKMLVRVLMYKIIQLVQNFRKICT